jgi:hypothetical protein
MKKKKHLQTDFLRFIFEKYSNQKDNTEGQDLPDDETEIPSRNKIRKMYEIEDEEEPIEEPIDKDDDEIIDELVNEYKRLKKKYESHRVYKRRR